MGPLVGIACVTCGPIALKIKQKFLRQSCSHKFASLAGQGVSVLDINLFYQIHKFLRLSGSGIVDGVMNASE